MYWGSRVWRGEGGRAWKEKRQTRGPAPSLLPELPQADFGDSSLIASLPVGQRVMGADRRHHKASESRTLACVNLMSLASRRHRCPRPPGYSCCSHVSAELGPPSPVGARQSTREANQDGKGRHVPCSLPDPEARWTPQHRNTAMGRWATPEWHALPRRS